MMSNKLAILFSGFFIIYCFASPSSGAENNNFQWTGVEGFQRHVILHENYVLFWNVLKESNRLHIALAVRTMGWVGFGISANGGMHGADMAVFHEVSEGKWRLEDMFSRVRGVTPIIDSTTQDVTLKKYSRENGVTVVEFMRDIDSCGGGEDFSIVEGPIWVIFAFGESGTFQQHKHMNRGQRQVNFLAPPNLPPPLEDDAFTISRRMPDHEVPAEDTTYICKQMTLPSDRKYQIVAYEPIVDSELVHHMILFRCRAVPDLNDKPTECEDMGNGCEQFLVGWGVGSRGGYLPKDVGIPIGRDENEDYAVYVKLEIHYDNPEFLAGIRDQSGFDLIITPSVRLYDAGVLTLGALWYDIEVPAFSPSYSIQNKCGKECTNMFPHPINVMSVALHAHLIGKSLWLEHVRDGKRLPDIGRQMWYDFNFQGAVPNYANTVIEPGDELITHCTWDNSGNPNPVLGGQKTSDEMCFAFVMYYPRFSFSFCSDVTEGALKTSDAGLQSLLDLGTRVTACIAFDKCGNSTDVTTETCGPDTFKLSFPESTKDIEGLDLLLGVNGVPFDTFHNPNIIIEDLPPKNDPTSCARDELNPFLSSDVDALAERNDSDMVTVRIFTIIVGLAIAMVM